MSTIVAPAGLGSIAQAAPSPFRGLVAGLTAPFEELVAQVTGRPADLDLAADSWTAAAAAVDIAASRHAHDRATMLADWAGEAADAFAALLEVAEALVTDVGTAMERAGLVAREVAAISRSTHQVVVDRVVDVFVAIVRRCLAAVPWIAPTGGAIVAVATGDVISAAAAAITDIAMTVAEFAQAVGTAHGTLAETDHDLTRAARLLDLLGSGGMDARAWLQEVVDGETDGAVLAALAGLGRHLDELGVTGPSLERQLDGMVGNDPEAVSAWWAGLTPGQRAHLLATRPDLVGNLDGVPLDVRHDANVAAVRDQLARQRRYLDADRVAALEALLSEAGRGAHVLGFSPDGDGRAIVAFGDIADADHVAVNVPGISNDLDNFAGLMQNAKNLQESATDLGQGSVASVAWLGYDTPGGIGLGDLERESIEAVLGGRSRAAAPDLSRFVAGIDATRGTHPHTTVIGHSYGSHVTADASRLAGLGADEYVLVGSPGAGVGHVSELGVPTGSTVWAESVGAFPDDRGGFGRQAWDSITNAVRGDDYVPSLPSTHGANPDAPGFGAEGFALGDVSGHGQYYLNGSQSLQSLATITVDGQPAPPEDGS